MKLVYLSTQRIPTEKAYGVQISSMCKSFALGGAEVTLLVPSRRGEQGDDVFAYYGIAPSTFRVTRLSAPEFHWPGFLERFAFWIVYSLASIRLAGHAKRLRPDVVYTRDFLPAAFLALIGVPVCFEEHRNRGAAVYRLLSVLRVPAVAVTGHLKSQMVAGGYQDREVLVGHDGADLKAFEIAATQEQERIALHLPENWPLVCYVGSLRTMGMEKGIRELIEAFAIAHAELPGCFLLIVGGSAADIAHYRTVTAQLQIQDAVLFVGHQSPQRVPRYLRAADIAVLPFPDNPHFSRDMSPLKLFEYMASGMPIIASDLPSVREIVSEKDVFFTKPGNHASLVAAIVESIRNTEEAARKGERVLQLANKYSWDARVRAITHFIKQSHDNI